MTPSGVLIGAGRQAEVFAWDDGRVLKLYRRAGSQHAAHAEAECTRLAYAAGAPAPAIHEMVSADGRPGTVYEWLDGPTMLSLLIARPWQVNRLARQMAALHTQLHRCSGAGLPAQCSGFRQLARWIEAHGDFAPALKATLVRVVSALPEGNRICHGDLHPGNVLLSADGPRVIDWTNAWCGHPLADVARTSIVLRFGTPPPGALQRGVISMFRALFHSLYLRHYFQAQTAYQRSELRAWELPLAVSRLADAVATERAALLVFIERRAAEIAQHPAHVG